MAELADALDSGSSVLTDVEVQILSSALSKNRGFYSSSTKRVELTTAIRTEKYLSLKIKTHKVSASFITIELD